MTSQKPGFTISEKNKQQVIDIIIQGFIQYVKNLSAIGKTSYTFDTVGISPHITKDDLVSGFKHRYPNWTVTYKEENVKISSFQNVLKKLLVIEWA